MGDSETNAAVESVFDKAAAQVKRTMPMTVVMLLLIGVIRMVLQLLSAFFTLEYVAFVLAHGSRAHEFLGSILQDSFAACVTVAAVIGLWRRKAWAWALWLVVSVWFLAGSMPIIDLVPRSAGFSFIVCVALSTRGARTWCNVDVRAAIRWILSWALLFLGWVWCSALLPPSRLPPDFAAIQVPSVIWSVACWVAFWASALAVAKGRVSGIILGCLASIMAAATMVMSLVEVRTGLQQRVLWAFSTVQGAELSWRSVGDKQVLLASILIGVNAVMVIFLVGSWKTILAKRIGVPSESASSSSHSSGAG